MFDRDGIWEMNKAHHSELLTAAATYRLLSRSRQHREVPLGLLSQVLAPFKFVLKGEFWSAHHLNQPGTQF